MAGVVYEWLRAHGLKRFACPKPDSDAKVNGLTGVTASANGAAEWPGLRPRKNEKVGGDEITLLGASDGESVDAQGRLPDANGDALTIFAAGSYTGIESEVVADQRDAG